ncbi:unnamed protein product [Peronospora farinosa]|uniref:Uncharacterized protein n=1 Tax=Peronospora farinosa TaxID=134698 RepID=A0AAV0TYW7_9STRA|nr:unnamed protein product [Peronospora farinosa]CAI5728030.1 unnamed protein product [Peronospora farinosa]
MDGEEQQKRLVHLSTVSLDSTYDQDESTEILKRPIRSRCVWTPFMVLAGLILVAVGLVLALDRGNTDHEGVVVDSSDEDPNLTAYSSLTSGEGLSAPEKKLVEWLNQAHNASELYVIGGSNNMSVTGVLFPRHGGDTSLPFNAMVAIDSIGPLPRRQYVALANGRGFEWVVTSLGAGDIIITNDCLTKSDSVVFDELDSIVSTANWTSSEIDNEDEVNVILDEVTYTVSKEEDDYFLSEEVVDQCWMIESEDEEFELRICASVAGEQLPPTTFEDLFNATSECPQLAPMATRTTLSVPLPLRKWYASYQA